MQSMFDSPQDLAITADALLVMIQKEQNQNTCDYLLGSSRSSSPPLNETFVTEADRIQIVDWCFDIVDKLELDRETVLIAIGMTGRYLSNPSAPNRKLFLRKRGQFQLLAMASLYIVIKTREQGSNVNAAFFSDLSHGLYSVEDIEDMERKLLHGISWRIWVPTSIQIARHMLLLIFSKVQPKESSKMRILDEVDYQTEHAARDYYLSIERTSTIAIAAIFNAINIVHGQDRQDLLCALALFVASFGLNSSREVQASKARLKCIVEGNESIREDASVVSETSSELKARCHKKLKIGA